MTEDEKEFFTAVNNNDFDTVKSLIGKVDVNARNYEGSTPLIKASFWGWTNIVRLLLDNHADIEAKDGSGFTALTHAVSWNHFDTIKLLLDNEADIYAKDNDNNDAFAWARMRGVNNKTTVQILENDVEKRKQIADKLLRPAQITAGDLYNESGKISRLGKGLAKDTVKLGQFLEAARVPYPLKRQYFLDAKEFIVAADKQKVMAILLCAHVAETEGKVHDER